LRYISQSDQDYKNKDLQLNESTLLESETREVIDTKLQSAGWEIQDMKKLNLVAGEYAVRGVA